MLHSRCCKLCSGSGQPEAGMGKAVSSSISCSTLSDNILSASLQVRWYSFQFLMEELAEELEEMHAVLGDLLTNLPRPFVLE